MTDTEITSYDEAIKYINKSSRYNNILLVFSEELRDNKELIIYVALQHKYGYITNISNHFKNDCDVAKLIIKNNEYKTQPNKQTFETNTSICYSNAIKRIRPGFLTKQDNVLDALLELNTQYFVNLQKCQKFDNTLHFDATRICKNINNATHNSLLTFLLKKYTYDLTKTIILKTHIARWTLYMNTYNEFTIDEDILLKSVLNNDIILEFTSRKEFKYASSKHIKNYILPYLIDEMYNVKQYINLMKIYYNNMCVKEQGKKIKKWRHIDINFRFN